jgi:hypothetical protein
MFESCHRRYAAVFVSQAGLSGDPKYIAFVDEAVAYAKEKAGSGDDAVALAIDRLAVRSQGAIQGVRVRDTEVWGLLGW